MNIADITAKIKEQVLMNFNLEEEPTDERTEEILDSCILSNEELKCAEVSVKLAIKREIFHSLRGFGVLEELLADPGITEIMVNGPDNIFVEKDGRLSLSDKKFSSTEELEDIIQRIVSGCNRVVNSTNPICDARLPGGERVCIVLAPVALNGPVVTIRRFYDTNVTMNKLVEWGSITPQAAEFLEELVKAKYTIFVSGGTGTGKTTLLNALSDFIPASERIITIEDNAELRLIGKENLVRLEVRGSNSSGCNEIGIRELIKASLRSRPDRIVVGEVRGKEALDMLQAMNTGHEGSMSTGHANSCKDCISRLENMVLMGVDMPLMAIRQQIASGLDIIVQLGRAADGSRKVTEITEVLGYENGEVLLFPLFVYKESESGGQLVKVGDLHNRKRGIKGLQPD